VVRFSFSFADVLSNLHFRGFRKMVFFPVKLGELLFKFSCCLLTFVGLHPYKITWRYFFSELYNAILSIWFIETMKLPKIKGDTLLRQSRTIGRMGCKWDYYFFRKKKKKSLLCSDRYNSHFSKFYKITWIHRPIRSGIQKIQWN
jgi:hypothetical protein